MNLTLGALQKLGAEAQVLCRRAAIPPVNAQHACLQLGITLRIIRENGREIKLDRPKLNVEAVWSKLAAARYDLNALNSLQFRALCTAEEIALRPEFVAALARHPEKLKRSLCLYGLVNGYFAGWRTMANPGTVEGLLISAFASYSAKNPIVQTWLAGAGKGLFSERAATLLSDEICSGRKAVDEVLNGYNVGKATKLGLIARASAAKSACEHLRRMEGRWDDEASLSYLQWMTEKVLSDLTLPDSFSDSFSEAVSCLILSESAKRSQSFQRALRSYIQNHKKLGDPRIRESARNWRSIAPEAAQRYLSWLARDSIIFFFNTILPNNSENQRRKDFWLRYHDRIKDFQVALSEADVWKVRSSQQGTDLLYYSRVDHATTSAFLMKFEGYGGQFLVIEFSEKGNAAYLYDIAAFESKGLTLRTPRFELKNHLKFDDTNRIVHNGDWEPKAAYRLALEFGIRP